MIKVCRPLKKSMWLVAVILSVMPTLAVAGHGGVFAYPMAGQTQEQRARDHAECQSWAVQQTGVGPAAPPPSVGSPNTSSGGFLNFGDGGFFSGGGALGDAATGAGLGAVGGALAGRPGLGAGIGALTGTLLGELGRSSARQEQRHREQQVQLYHEQQARYNRAYGSCMSARNYSVR